MAKLIPRKRHAEWRTQPENTPCPMAYSTRENAMPNGEFNLAKFTRENAMTDGEFNLRTRHAEWRVTLFIFYLFSENR